VFSSTGSTLGNTIVAGNTGLPDVTGTFTSQGNNLIGAADGSTGWVSSDLTGTSAHPLNPLLAPLGNNGGTTQTMTLLPGSPAIDAGNNTLIPAGVTTDQRGLPRTVGSAVDIGACESQGFTLTLVAGSTPQSAAIGAPFANPLAVTVTANNALEPVNGGVVRFAAQPAASGALALLSPSAAVISGGQAGTTAAPNNANGSYQVAASATGSTSVSFALTNTGPTLASLVVNTTSDSFAPGAGLLSLREAIGLANADHSGVSTITFDGTVFNTAKTVTLTGGQLELSNTSETETITGPAAGVTVSGGGLSRVFQVDTQVAASISGLTITGGKATDKGGGVFSSGALTLTDCSVSGNSAGSGGGGVYGGGGSIALTNCTLTGNSAAAGGGLYTRNSLTTAALINCTVSGNSASNPRFTNPFNGGGLYAANFSSISLGNTIVAGNTARGTPDIGADQNGTFTSDGNNLIGDPSGNSIWAASDLTGASGNPLNPLLAPLGAYGGPTQTMALLPGSPAIDAGNSFLVPTGVTTDQRGLGRTVGSAVDIGAFESQGFTLTLAAGSTPQTATIGTPFANPLAVTITANNPVEPVNGGVVSFAAQRTNGAVAILSAASAVIKSGQVAVTASPNNGVGASQIVASATGSASASFALTNTGPSFASLVVNTTSDSVYPGAGLLSLREAVAFANFDSLGISSITFDGTVFNTAKTITLTGSQLELSNASETETITGPAAGVTVSGGSLSRVCTVDGMVTASISGLTIIGGNTARYGNYASGGGVSNAGSLTLANCDIANNSSYYAGCGVFNSGSLTMNNCTVSGNGFTGRDSSAGNASGGGVYNSGTLSMSNSTVSGNSAVLGGGLYNASNASNATASLSNCTVSGNTAKSAGGGIFSYSKCTVTLTNCTVSGNSTVDPGAAGGGGVYNGRQSTLTMTDCTVSGNADNSSGGGGGVFTNRRSTTTLTNCTISGNSTTNQGGGLENDSGCTTTLTNCTVVGNTASGSGGGGGIDNRSGTVTIGNTVVAVNTAASGLDAFGTFASQGNNLIGVTGGSSGWGGSDLTGTAASPLNPLLAPLGNYGGLTQTMAPLPGSPAIDAGSSSLIPTGVTTDQRGLPRTAGTSVDIGACESRSPGVTSHFQVTGPETAALGNSLSFTVTAVDQNLNPTGSGYTGIVHFTSTDGAATLPAGVTLTNGTGVFTATFNNPGAQTITASDSASQGITGTSNLITAIPLATRFAVNAPATVTAGAPFVVTVTALDATGRTATGYDGTLKLTSTDGQAVLPQAVTLTDGVGSFVVTLKTVAGAPWTITATDTIASSLTGASGMIAVSPANASFFAVVTPTDATTGSSISATITAMDAYGNVAAGYAGHIHFTSTDPGASLPGDAVLTGGTGIFNVTLNTAGDQTITATDAASLAALPSITGTSSAITTRGLVVSGTKVGGSSVEIDFSKPFDPTKLTMYGSGLSTVQDFTLVGATNGAISGTLYVDPSNMSVTFKATEATLSSFFGTSVLPDDHYTLTVVSGTTNGFVDTLGTPLDGGNNAGHANYTTSFMVANSSKQVLSLPDFARGPNGANPINIPAATAGAGIPVTLSNAIAVTDVKFTLAYNPSLLTVTGANGGNLTMGTPNPIDATHATVDFTYHNGTAQNGTVNMGSITANVPNSAGSQYKAKELLTLSDITVNGAAFTGVAASAIHVNAYFGDVTGNGSIDALDVAFANSVAQGNATGFVAYPLLDPAIIGDVAGDISVDAGDVSTLAAYVSQLPTPQIPAIPAGPTITPTGPDPTLSLGEQGGVYPRSLRANGGVINVSVQLDQPHPAGSSGMTEAILALKYDPSVLSVSSSDITLGSIPSLGAGWQLTSVIDQTTGVIAITLYSTTPISANNAGSLVNIVFRIDPLADAVRFAHAPLGSVQLVNSVTVNGEQFVTQVDDAQGQYVLSPGRSWLEFGIGRNFRGLNRKMHANS
jgi:parallel beta-helix repeat protein